MTRAVGIRAGVVLLCAVALPALADTLKIDGEVYARETASLMPPSVDALWQFTVTQLAPDGAPVKQGEMVLAFDGGELSQQLVSKQSVLKEKQTQLGKLQLELADRARDATLATAEAQSGRAKAELKTQQPESLVAGIEYKKLLVARRQAQRKFELALVRERAAAEQRLQERRLLESEVAQLQSEVDQLQASLAAMNVPAPRSGLMMHRSRWNGEKFDVGSQVWRGQAVAEIPDTSTLAVRAELPERDLQRVALGAAARIVIEGGAGRSLSGKVAGIGRAVRSKSRVQPIPVLDLEIALDDSSAALKPGQAVRVELAVEPVLVRSRAPETTP